MWAILKFESKSIETLKKEFSKVLGKDYIIYMPKLFIQKYIYEFNKFLLLNEMVILAL